MRNTKLLSLTIFKHHRDTAVCDVGIAIKRVEWALRTIAHARANPETLEGRALHTLGFIACVFKGPTGTEYVAKFDLGHALVISDDGRDVIDEGLGELNVKNAQEFLTMVLAYATWVSHVELAADEHRRPMVFDNSKMLSVPPEIRQWIGGKAEEYFKTWHSLARQTAANTVSAQVVTA